MRRSVYRYTEPKYAEFNVFCSPTDEENEIDLHTLGLSITELFPAMELSRRQRRSKRAKRDEADAYRDDIIEYITVRLCGFYVLSTFLLPALLE